MTLTLETLSMNAMDSGARTTLAGGMLAVDRAGLIRLVDDERVVARVEAERARGAATVLTRPVDEPTVRDRAARVGR